MHRLRHIFRASLATPGTVRLDKPRLNVRAKFTLPVNDILQIKSSSYSFADFEIFWEKLLDRYKTLPSEQIKQIEQIKQQAKQITQKVVNYRYFILPKEWKKAEIKTFFIKQKSINSNFHFISYTEKQKDYIKKSEVPSKHFSLFLKKQEKKKDIILASLKKIKEDGLIRL